MCRILLFKSKEKTAIEKYLKSFARMCKNSSEFQGHGWGMAYQINGSWSVYKNILPVWKDNLNQFPESDYFIIHARSAFEDRDIKVENNMPFIKEQIVFAFNGELRGVKLKMEGRIGAEKIFNYILRFYQSDLLSAVEKAAGLIRKRTKYIRAMNIVLADKNSAVIYSQYSESENYFTLRKHQDASSYIICSEELDIVERWERIENNYTGEIKW